jgi:type I restriction enzyme S subunit
VISRGPSVLRLARFVNGSPFRPDDLGTEGYPVIRIKHLLDATVEPEFAKPPEPPVFIDTGDLVFSWSATLATRRWDRGRALLNQHLFRVDPVAGVHCRWLQYALDVGIERLKPLMHGSAMTHVTRDMLRGLTVALPALAEQRAIADFLDTETARIDALITKKRRMVELLRGRSVGAVELAVRTMALEDGEVPLKRLVTEVTVGIVVTPSEWYSPQGVIALRGLNVRPGRLDTSDVVYLTPEGHRLHRKSALRCGDVVVVRTGQAGAAAVVPGALEGVNCVDLLIVRPGEMDPNFLTFMLNSDWTQKHIASNSVGSIQSHFNVGALRELPVPNSTLERQRRATQQLHRTTTHLSEGCDRLTRQIELLQEHRQALITAAVTGELAVPGAAA